MGSLELPPFQEGEVREDIVGIHRGRPNQDVVGDMQRELLDVPQDFDIGVTGGQGVGRRLHVGDQSLDRVGVGIADRGDGLLVNVASQWVPIAFGGVPLKDSGLLVVETVPNTGDPKGGELTFRLADVEEFTLADAMDIVLRGRYHTALGVEVAQQHIDRVPAQHVVETVGVLGDAAVDVDTGGLAVAGELGSDLDNRLFLNAANLCPLGQSMFLCGLEDQLQAALDHCAVGQLGLNKEVTEDRALLVVDINCCWNAADHRDEEFLVVLLLLLGGGVDICAFLRCFQRSFIDDHLGCPHESTGLSVLDLDQQTGVGPRALSASLRGCGVGALQEVGVKALVLYHPTNEGHRKGAVRAGSNRQILPRLAGELAKARVGHGDLRRPGGEVLGEPGSAISRAVVALEQVGTDKEDKFGLLVICLPVELLAVGELTTDVLLANCLGCKVERTLADRGVAVRVDSAQTLGEALVQIPAPLLEPAP